MQKTYPCKTGGPGYPQGEWFTPPPPALALLPMPLKRLPDQVHRIIKLVKRCNADLYISTTVVTKIRHIPA
ncbi:MAG TPA: hypothetical protein VNG51_24210 [Ktedonobacteraceae bacterium]|nr:hypothetical protein [Ktedonobacteraceae bacterium]